MRISLRPELAKFVEEKVRAGHFPDADPVVNGALDAMRVQEASTAEDIEALRKELAEAVAQADRGEFVEFDAKSIIAEGRAELRRRWG